MSKVRSANRCGFSGGPVEAASLALADRPPRSLAAAALALATKDEAASALAAAFAAAFAEGVAGIAVPGAAAVRLEEYGPPRRLRAPGNPALDPGLGFQR